MESYLLNWGPTILVAAVVLIVFRAAFARQAKYFKTQADNAAAQVAELSKIQQSLDRIVAAMEAKGRSQNSN